MNDNELFIKKLTDIQAVINLPVRVWDRYGTPEYWKKLEIELNHEAKDLVEFIRDHRSRDYYEIDIVKSYSMNCKFCGYAYPDNFNGIADCCEEMIEAQNIKIESI
jgi:hypothetical protein